MKIVTFDGGFHFDDPNIYWGDPAYQLEPGDPGYIPPPQPTPQTPTKIKRMKRNTYFPSRAADQLVWLVNFCNKIAGHAAALGLTTQQVNDAKADCNWLVYVLQSWLGAVRAWALACTDAATEAQTGDGTALMALPVFTVPALPTGVAPTNTGALNRIFALVQTIKDSGKATETIQTDLGIIGSEMTGPDMDTIQPSFKARVTAAGVDLPWTWNGHAAFLDMIEFQVDRSDGKGYVPLCSDTTPGYTDTFPKPATPTKWTYRAIFRVGDHQVGQWSNPVSVLVGG
ncbi:MAG TPA: hypothetical protein VI454_16765 [Verrucomicrobiae bacterium]|jgi:hypothetical protein